MYGDLLGHKNGFLLLLRNPVLLAANNILVVQFVPLIWWNTVTQNQTAFETEKELIVEVFSRIADNPDIVGQKLSSDEFMGTVGGRGRWLPEDEISEFEEYMQEFASEVVSTVKAAETREEVWTNLYEVKSGEPLRGIENFLTEFPSDLLSNLDRECGLHYKEEIDAWITELENQKCLDIVVNSLFSYFLLDEEIAKNYSNRFGHEIQSLADDLIDIRRNPVEEIHLAKRTAMSFGPLWEDLLPPLVYATKSLSKNYDPIAESIRDASLADLISDFRTVMNEFNHLSEIVATLSNEQRKGLLHGGTSGPRLIHPTREIEIQYQESGHSSRIETQRIAYREFSIRVVKAGVAIIALYSLTPLLLGRYVQSHSPSRT